MKKAISALAICAMSGCSALGPDFMRPSIEMDASFDGASATSERKDAGSTWWTALQDPILNDLVSLGLAQNLDIKTALERIVAAEANAARFGIERQLSGDVAIDARVGETEGVSTDGTTLRGDAFFVFDLFGEFRRGREQSVAELEATAFDAGTVRLAFLADLVSNYIQMRNFQTAARITRETVRSRERARDLTRERVAVNDATQLELARASALAAEAKADLPIFEAQARVNAYRIATLLNMPTDLILRKTSGHAHIPAPKHALGVGVPADLLLRRPDVRAAERRFAAATAAIGVTEAQLYPSLGIRGNVGIGETDAWSLGPTLALPILDRRNLLSNRDVARSEARQAELAYRVSILDAVEETQTALVLLHAREKQVAARLEASRNSDNAMNLAMRSFEANALTLTEVLDSEQLRLDNRLDLAQAQADRTQAWAQLQIALGGFVEGFPIN